MGRGDQERVGHFVLSRRSQSENGFEAGNRVMEYICHSVTCEARLLALTFCIFKSFFFLSLLFYFFFYLASTEV